jgi:hypothetical protein
MSRFWLNSALAPSVFYTCIYPRVRLTVRAGALCSLCGSKASEKCGDCEELHCDNDILSKRDCSWVNALKTSDCGEMIKRYAEAERESKEGKEYLLQRRHTAV